MKCTLLAATFTLFVFSGTALSNDYWPVVYNSTYHYVDSNGNELEVATNSYGQRISTWPEYYMRQVFETDGEGNVWMSFWEGMNTAPGYIHIPYSLYFSPPLQIWPATLEVGQTGSYSTIAVDDYGNTSPVYCHWEVTSEEVVEVPAGRFDTIVVEVTQSDAMIQGTYYLSAGVGPVIYPNGFRLIETEGIVSTSETSWGSLKSLYR